MILDTEEHRKMILDALNAAAIPGSLAERWAALKAAVAHAEVAKPAAPKEDNPA